MSSLPSLSLPTLSDASETSHPVRVVVSDPQEVVREGIRSWLRQAPRFELVAEFPHPGAVFDWMQTENADLVILGTEPDLEATHRVSVRILEKATSAKVVWFGTSAEEECLQKAKRTGIQGYLLRGTSRREFLGALENLSVGRLVLSPEVAESLWRGPETRPGVIPLEFLRPREREILERIVQGDSNKEIASALRLSPGTLRNQVSLIYSKLGVTNRTAAVALWLRGS